MPAKLKLECIKREFEEKGYTLTTTEYVGSKKRLKYICSRGHHHSTRIDHFRNGRRCLHCYEEDNHKNIEFIRKEFEKEDYILLSKQYKNNRQKLNYTCPNGHCSSISWDSWQQGRRCLKCDYENRKIRTLGPGNPGWKGGISCEPYCEVWLDRDFKESIRIRDNYECQNPFCNGKSTNLCIHHIDYNKKNCHPSNIITICRSCNAIANFNREWHTSFYKEIMRRNNFSKNQINQEDLSCKEEIL
jgi:hypothetical protein